LQITLTSSERTRWHLYIMISRGEILGAIRRC